MLGLALGILALLMLVGVLTESTSAASLSISWSQRPPSEVAGSETIHAAVSGMVGKQSEVCLKEDELVDSTLTCSDVDGNYWERLTADVSSDLGLEPGESTDLYAEVSHWHCFFGACYRSHDGETPRVTVTRPDDQAPDVSITSVSQGGTEITVDARISDEGGSGLDASSIVLDWSNGGEERMDHRFLDRYRASFSGAVSETGTFQVRARDNAGNQGSSDIRDYQIDDNREPSISNVRTSTDGKTVTVVAEVSDVGSGVDRSSVNLKWDCGFLCSDSDPMSGSGGSYEGSFQDDWGETGDVWIEAADLEENTAESSRTSYAIPENRGPSIRDVNVETAGRTATVSARVEDHQGAGLDPSTVTLHRDPADDLIDHPFDEKGYEMENPRGDRFEASFPGEPGESGEIWITAADDAGARAGTGRTGYHLADDVPPKVANCEVDPSGTSLTVSADVKDQGSGVSEVTLVHSIGGSSGTTPMEKGWAGGLPLVGKFLPYEVTVEGDSHDRYNVHVRATDQSGNDATGCSETDRLDDTQAPSVEITRVDDTTPPVEVQVQIRDAGIGIDADSVTLDPGTGFFDDPIQMAKTGEATYEATFDADVGTSGTLRVTASDAAGNEGSADRTFEVESGNSKITGVLANRVPAQTMESIVPQDQTGTIWGAPQGLEAFARVDIDDGEGGDYRVSWSATSPGVSEPEVQAATESRELDPGSHTLRVPLDAGPLGALGPGTYEFEFQLEVKTTTLPPSFAALDTATKQIEIRPGDEAPLVAEPTRDVDEDDGSEPVLGNIYQAAELPERTLKDAFLQTLNVIGAAGGGDCCVIPGVFITSPKEQMDQLALQTASLNVETGDEGRVQLSWRNTPVRAEGGHAPLRISYDRAMLSASFPSDVTVEDDGGADYRVTEEGTETLVWITTRVDKGIEPNPLDFGEDPPNQQVTIGLRSGEDETVEIDADVRLMLGPLRGKVSDIQPFVTSEPLDEVPAVYDYEAWQANPDEAYWMSLGFASETAEAEFGRGTLAIDVQDTGRQPVDGASVSLWRDNYEEQLETQDTDPSGTATWTGLKTGKYTFEVRNGGFWGAGAIDLERGGTDTTFTRTEPTLDGVTFHDRGDGDDHLLTKEPVLIEPHVRNPPGGPDRDTRVQVLVDADGDGESDKQATRGGSETTIRDGGEQFYGFEVTPETPGTHRVRVKTEAFVNDRWQQTDDSGWTKSFEAVETEPREPPATVTEVDLSGGGEVVRREVLDDRRGTATASGGALPVPLDPPEYSPPGGNPESGPSDSLHQVQGHDEYPNSAIGYLQMSYDQHPPARCTGTLIEDNHVLTTGHCIWNSSRSPAWPESVRFSPGLSGGDRPFGSAEVKFLQLYEGWTKSSKVDWDLAVLTLAEPLGRYTGTFGYDAFVPESLLSDVVSRIPGVPSEVGKYEEFAYTTGYSADPPGPVSHSRDQWEGFQRLNMRGGPQLGIGDGGPVVSCFLNDRCIEHGVPETGGASGGPTWQPASFSSQHNRPYVLSVHHGNLVDLRVEDSGLQLHSEGGVRITAGKFSDIGRMIDRGNEVVETTDEPHFIDAGSDFHQVQPKTVVAGQTLLDIRSALVNRGTDPGGCRDVTYQLQDHDGTAVATLATKEVCSVTPFWETRRVEVQAPVPSEKVEAGTYVLAADIEGSSTTTMADIEVQAPGRLQVTETSSNTPIQEGNSLSVTTTLRNDGDVSATKPVSLTVGGEERASQELQLDAGESRQVELVWDTDPGAAGSYTAQVATPTDASSLAVEITAAADPQPSIAWTPKNPEAGETVTLDGSGSSDDGQITDYRWTVEGSDAGSGPKIEHTFEQPGPHTIGLTVTDASGLEATATRTVEIAKDTAPIPRIAMTTEVPQPGHPVILDASPSQDDGEIVGYTWRIGGQTVGTGATLEHTFDELGDHDIELTVTDDAGQTATAMQTITVDATNEAPTASVSVTPSEPVVGDEVTLDARDSQDDGSITSYTWQFGEEVAGEGPTLEHVFDEAGSYAVELTVTDDDGATDTATQTLSVEPADEPPRLLPPPLAIAGEDRRVSLDEVQTGIDLWANDDPVPGTRDRILSLDHLQTVIDAWADERPLRPDDIHLGGPD